MIDLLSFITAPVVGATAGLGGAGFTSWKYFNNLHKERKSLRMGFLVEVDRLLWVIKRHSNYFGCGKDDPLIAFTTDFYDKQIENIGKLPSDLVAPIVRFYGFVKFLNQIQLSRKEYGIKGRSGFNRLYVSQLQNFRSNFQLQFIKYFEVDKIQDTQMLVKCEELDNYLDNHFGKGWNGQ